MCPKLRVWVGPVSSSKLGRSFVFLLKAFSSFFGPAAGDVLAKLNDDAVVNDPIDGGRGGHRVFEDAVPLGEHEIGSNDHAAAFVAFGQEGKEDFHLFSALLDVADVVQDEDVKTVQPPQLGFEFEVAPGSQETVHQAVGWGK